MSIISSWASTGSLIDDLILYCNVSVSEEIGAIEFIIWWVITLNNFWGDNDWTIIGVLKNYNQESAKSAIANPGIQTVYRGSLPKNRECI